MQYNHNNFANLARPKASHTSGDMGIICPLKSKIYQFLIFNRVLCLNPPKRTDVAEPDQSVQDTYPTPISLSLFYVVDSSRKAHNHLFQGYGNGARTLKKVSTLEFISPSFSLQGKISLFESQVSNFAANNFSVSYL